MTLTDTANSTVKSSTPFQLERARAGETVEILRKNQWCVLEAYAYGKDIYDDIDISFRAKETTEFTEKNCLYRTKVKNLRHPS